MATCRDPVCRWSSQVSLSLDSLACLGSHAPLAAVPRLAAPRFAWRRKSFPAERTYLKSNPNPFSFRGSSPGTHRPEAPASAVAKHEPGVQLVPGLNPENERIPVDGATGLRYGAPHRAMYFRYSPYSFGNSDASDNSWLLSMKPFRHAISSGQEILSPIRFSMAATKLPASSRDS